MGSRGDVCAGRSCSGATICAVTDIEDHHFQCPSRGPQRQRSKIDMRITAPAPAHRPHRGSAIAPVFCVVPPPRCPLHISIHASTIGPTFTPSKHERTHEDTCEDDGTRGRGRGHRQRQKTASLAKRPITGGISIPVHLGKKAESGRQNGETNIRAACTTSSGRPVLLQANPVTSTRRGRLSYSNFNNYPATSHL